MTVQDSLDIVASYLRDEALFHNSKTTVEEVLPQLPLPLPEVIEPTSTMSIEAPPSLQRRKSVFHNFQKHLICLLRRHIEMNDLEA